MLGPATAARFAVPGHPPVHRFYLHCATIGGIEGSLLRFSSTVIIINEDGDSPRRVQLIREAAQRPTVYGALWSKYGAKLPGDSAIKSYLTIEEGFRPEAADQVVRDYRETFKFAKLDESAAKPHNTAVEVGVEVQWVSQGVAQFPEPRQVEELSEDGQWVFVVGSTTGIPIKEVEVVTSAANATTHQPAQTPVGEHIKIQTPPIRTLPPSKSGTKQDVFALDSGEVLVRWPDSLTENDYNDIKDWLTILERKIGRSVKKAEPESPSDN